jgi:uncharacterized membrane protein
MKEKANIQEKFHVITHPNILPTTPAQNAADKLTKWIGSWPFIIIFFAILVFWILTNIFAWMNSWDPYPFILLNLLLSCIAAIQAPIILMSQNRANQKERLRAEYDYAIDKKSEKEIEQIQKQLERIERKLNEKR